MQNLTYRRIEDLPQDVREYLPIPTQRAFLESYNQFLNQGCDWGSAFQLAWARLKLND